MFNLSPDPIHQALIMAKDAIVLNLNNVKSSKDASNIEDKQFNALNGNDTALREGARLLLLSARMKEEKRTIGTRTFDSQFFWALDLNRGSMEKVSRSGLAGGIGYVQLPQPGQWTMSEDGKWLFLKPQDDDPAVRSMKSWGIRYTFPGAFYKDDKKMEIPRAFLLEVTHTEWLASRGPISVSAPVADKEKQMANSNFRAYGSRLWEGTARFLKPEELTEIISKWNDEIGQFKIDLEQNKDMFKL